MDYYHQALEARARQQDAARQRARRRLIAEARRAAQRNHRPRLLELFRLWRRKPPQPCPTCPEFA